MSINWKLWNEEFSRTDFPFWSCPHCYHGRLIVDEKSISILEPAFSKKLHSQDEFEPDWVTQRFSAWMKCSDAGCGEVVVVSGDSVIRQVGNEEFGWVYESFLRPRTAFPAPPIITLPKETPEVVRVELDAAFQHFWSDLGASANRLRASVERLLDNFKIPRTQTRTDRNTGNREPVFRPLASRIDLFKREKPEHAESLHALRHVGNLGTHSDVSRRAVLAGFEIYEDALAEIYGKRSERIGCLRKRVIKAKGKLI